MKGKTSGQAILAGFSSDGTLVFEPALDLSDYWDELHPVIDEDSFRRERSIRKLVGRLYDSEGQVLQEFESTYDETGKLLTSRACHEYRTETNFPP